MTGEFERETMDLPTGPVTYFVAGAGHDVVYLHPAAGMRISDALRRLATRFRVWAPVVPGFDGTALHETVDTMPALADLLAAFIESGPGRAVDVVGSSLGGWLGAWFAIRHPDLGNILCWLRPPVSAPWMRRRPRSARRSDRLCAEPRRAAAPSSSPPRSPPSRPTALHG